MFGRLEISAHTSRIRERQNAASGNSPEIIYQQRKMKKIPAGKKTQSFFARLCNAFRGCIRKNRNLSVIRLSTDHLSTGLFPEPKPVEKIQLNFTEILDYLNSVMPQRSP